MRKIFLICFLLVSALCFGQYPVNQTIGSDSTLVTSRGGFKGRIINWSFADTAAANLQRIRQYPGAQIFTTVDSAMWFRSPIGNKWIQMFANTGGGGGGDTLVWKMSGNTVGLRQATPVLGTLDLYDLNVITDGVTRFVVPSNGINRSSAASNKYLMIDTIGKYLYYGDAGSSNAWSILGNSGTSPSTNWLGTNDNQPIILKMNNLPYGFWGVTAGFAMGQYASDSMRQMGIYTNIAIGARNLRWSANTSFAGNTAVGAQSMRLNVDGYRNTGLGSLAMHTNTNGIQNTALGWAAGERLTGSYNTYIGAVAGRSGGDGTGNTAIGHASLNENTTWISAINVVSGGSGYTTATVVITAPALSGTGVNSVQATATATISSGVITGITITNNGAGYTNAGTGYTGFLDQVFTSANTPVAATITGDGTGATLSVELASGDYNVAIGEGVVGRVNFVGDYNVFLGTGAGSLTSSRRDNDYGTLLGAYADYLPSTPKLTNVTAIGYNSRVGQSNSIVLGDTVAVTNVGIGTAYPDATSLLDVKSTTRGILIPRMTTAQRSAISSPATSLLLFNTDSAKFEFYTGSAWAVIGGSSGGGGGVTTLAAIGSTPNANGATISGSTLNLEPANASFGGVVTTGSQTFAGDKTFNGLVTGRAGSAAGVTYSFGGTNAATGFWSPGANQISVALTGINYFTFEEGQLKVRNNWQFGFATGDPTVTSADVGFIRSSSGTITVNDGGGTGTPGGDLRVADEAYDATAWNGSLEVPTKNAIRDKFEDMFLSGSATLDFGSTAASSSADLTITVTGAADGDAVSLGVPNGSVNGNSCYTAWVSATNTVTVRFNNYQTVGAIDPASGTFKVRVIK
jgi:hypothetical protein